jgi:hypothetical protein
MLIKVKIIECAVWASWAERLSEDLLWRRLAGYQEERQIRDVRIMHEEFEM